MKLVIKLNFKHIQVTSIHYQPIYYPTKALFRIIPLLILFYCDFYSLMLFYGFLCFGQVNKL